MLKSYIRSDWFWLSDISCLLIAYSLCFFNSKLETTLWDVHKLEAGKCVKCLSSLLQWIDSWQVSKDVLKFLFWDSDAPIRAISALHLSEFGFNRVASVYLRKIFMFSDKLLAVSLQCALYNPCDWLDPTETHRLVLDSFLPHFDVTALKSTISCMLTCPNSNVSMLTFPNVGWSIPTLFFWIDPEWNLSWGKKNTCRLFVRFQACCQLLTGLCSENHCIPPGHGRVWGKLPKRWEKLAGDLVLPHWKQKLHQAHIHIIKIYQNT
jgi:hypothetical protein